MEKKEPYFKSLNKLQKQEKTSFFVYNFSTLNKNNESLTLKLLQFVNLVVQSLITVILIQLFIYWLCFSHCCDWFRTLFFRKEIFLSEKLYHLVINCMQPFQWTDFTLKKHNNLSCCSCKLLYIQNPSRSVFQQIIVLSKGPNLRFV